MTLRKKLGLYMRLYIFSFRFFSHIGDQRTLGRVPCAGQRVPMGQPFQRPPCARANMGPFCFRKTAEGSALYFCTSFGCCGETLGVLLKKNHSALQGAQGTDTLKKQQTNTQTLRGK